MPTATRAMLLLIFYVLPLLESGESAAPNQEEESAKQTLDLFHAIGRLAKVGQKSANNSSSSSTPPNAADFRRLQVEHDGLLTSLYEQRLCPRVEGKDTGGDRRAFRNPQLELQISTHALLYLAELMRLGAEFGQSSPAPWKPGEDRCEEEAGEQQVSAAMEPPVSDETKKPPLPPHLIAETKAKFSFWAARLGARQRYRDQACSLLGISPQLCAHTMPDGLDSFQLAEYANDLRAALDPFWRVTPPSIEGGDKLEDQGESRSRQRVADRIVHTLHTAVWSLRTPSGEWKRADEEGNRHVAVMSATALHALEEWVEELTFTERMAAAQRWGIDLKRCVDGVSKIFGHENFELSHRLARMLLEEEEESVGDGVEAREDEQAGGNEGGLSKTTTANPSPDSPHEQSEQSPVSQGAAPEANSPQPNSAQSPLEEADATKSSPKERREHFRAWIAEALTDLLERAAKSGDDGAGGGDKLATSPSSPSAAPQQPFSQPRPRETPTTVRVETISTKQKTVYKSSKRAELAWAKREDFIGVLAKLLQSLVNMYYRAFKSSITTLVSEQRISIRRSVSKGNTSGGGTLPGSPTIDWARFQRERINDDYKYVARFPGNAVEDPQLGRSANLIMRYKQALTWATMFALLYIANSDPHDAHMAEAWMAKFMGRLDPLGEEETTTTAANSEQEMSADACYRWLVASIGAAGKARKAALESFGIDMPRCRHLFRSMAVYIEEWHAWLENEQIPRIRADAAKYDQLIPYDVVRVYDPYMPWRNKGTWLMPLLFGRKSADWLWTYAENDDDDGNIRKWEPPMGMPSLQCNVNGEANEGTVAGNDVDILRLLYELQQTTVVTTVKKERTTRLENAFESLKRILRVASKRKEVKCEGGKGIHVDYHGIDMRSGLGSSLAGGYSVPTNVQAFHVPPV